MFRVGVCKTDITPDCVGVGMLGWGDADHRVKGVKKPLYARAVVIGHDTAPKRLIFVCVELCFVTEAVREMVLEVLTKQHASLNVREDELLITAVHTHNAPGGHSRYLLYNLTVPGFQPAVFQTYVEGIVRAIVEAFAKLEPAVLRVGSDFFPADSKVAFNRSLKAWRRNPEAKAGEEIDREMVLLRIDSEKGKPLACINWFSVHATSIHRDCHFIHSDNKGVASEFFETDLKKKGQTSFVAIFAQGAAGDVTPNYVKHRGLRDVRGPFRSDEQSCEFNARLQCERAIDIYEKAAAAAPLSGTIETLFEKHDFSKVDVAPEFAGGVVGAKTGPAAIGCNFLRGTAEGRGAPGWLVLMAVFLARVERYIRYFTIRIRGKKIKPPWRFDSVQGPKVSFMESGRARIFGVSRLTEIFLPGWIHPVVRNLKRIARESAVERRPFTPQILPLQIIRLGAFVVVAVPAEFTTVSGRRLCLSVERSLSSLNIERVVLCGFSNAYSGYVATCEEYQVQAYEGASTHFGMWTLGAYQTLFSRMCRWMCRG